MISEAKIKFRSILLIIICYLGTNSVFAVGECGLDSAKHNWFEKNTTHEVYHEGEKIKVKIIGTNGIFENVKSSFHPAVWRFKGDIDDYDLAT